MIERGLVPENLPPAEDVQKVEHRLNNEKKKMLKQWEAQHLDSMAGNTKWKKQKFIELGSKGKISSKNDHFWKKQNKRKSCNAL